MGFCVWLCRIRRTSAKSLASSSAIAADCTQRVGAVLRGRSIDARVQKRAVERVHEFREGGANGNKRRVLGGKRGTR